MNSTQEYLKKIKKEYPGIVINTEYLQRHEMEVDYAAKYNLKLTEFDDWCRFNDLVPINDPTNYFFVKDTLKEYERISKKGIMDISHNDLNAIKKLQVLYKVISKEFVDIELFNEEFGSIPCHLNQMDGKVYSEYPRVLEDLYTHKVNVSFTSQFYDNDGRMSEEIIDAEVVKGADGSLYLSENEREFDSYQLEQEGR